MASLYKQQASNITDSEMNNKLAILQDTQAISQEYQECAFASQDQATPMQSAELPMHGQIAGQ